MGGHRANPFRGGGGGGGGGMDIFWNLTQYIIIPVRRKTLGMRLVPNERLHDVLLC